MDYIASINDCTTIYDLYNLPAIALIHLIHYDDADQLLPPCNQSARGWQDFSLSFFISYWIIAFFLSLMLAQFQVGNGEL